MPKYPQSASRRECRIAQQLSKRMQQFPFIFSEALHFCLSILKNQRIIEKLYKLSAALLLIIFNHIIPLLARLRQVQQPFSRNRSHCRMFNQKCTCTFKWICSCTSTCTCTRVSLRICMNMYSTCISTRKSIENRPEHGHGHENEHDYQHRYRHGHGHEMNTNMNMKKSPNANMNVSMKLIINAFAHLHTSEATPVLSCTWKVIRLAK